jgi:hypothetical protein
LRDGWNFLDWAKPNVQSPVDTSVTPIGRQCETPPDTSPTRFRFGFGKLELSLQRFVERVLCFALAKTSADQFLVQTPVANIDIG